MSKQIGVDQSLARRHNSAAILDHLRLHAPLSRAGLARYTGLTRSSISRIIDQLVAENLVQETALQSEGIGRPGTLLELNPSGGAAIGVELGVDTVSVVLANFTAQVQWRQPAILPADSDLPVYLEAAEDLVQAALNQAETINLRPLGIGAGVWGLVDTRHGEVRFAPNLKWRDVPLKQRWERRFGLTVYVENDANAAAMGEYYFGAAKNVEDFIYLSTGVGLGGGIIHAGRLFRGLNGFAGEVGHMTIDPDGELCMCGKRGCWETLVGSRVAVQRYRAATGEELAFEELVRRFQAGDPASLEIFTRMAQALGTGMGSLVNIFNPRCIVLGWLLSQVSELILPLAQESFEKNSLRQSRADLKIIPSALGADACVLGCVALVIDEVIRMRV